MKLKKILSLTLVLLLALSLAACNGGFQAGGSDSSDPSGEEMVIGPLSGESDEALITRFVAEYAKALSSAAYVVQYGLSVRLDGDPQVEASGLFAVNGEEFSANLETSSIAMGHEKTKASCVYVDGVLYSNLNGAVTQTETDAVLAKAQLEQLGLTFDQIATSSFASKTLTRNMDGTYTVNVTLSEDALSQISAAALADAALLSETVEFGGVTLALDFSMNGDLLRNRLETTVNLTVEETVLPYCTEVYLQYTTFDPSKIVITPPSAE